MSKKAKDFAENSYYSNCQLIGWYSTNTGAGTHKGDEKWH